MFANLEITKFIRNIREASTKLQKWTIDSRTVRSLRYVNTHRYMVYRYMYIQGLRTKLNAYWQSPRCLSALCTYHYNVCGLARSTRQQRTSITSSNPGHRRQIRPPPICQQSRHSVSINSLAL